MKKFLCLTIPMILLLSVAFSGCAGASANQAANPNPGSSPAATANASESASPASSGSTGQAKDKAFTIKVSSWDLVDEDSSVPADKQRVIPYKAEVEKEYKAIYPNAAIQWDNTAGAAYFDLLNSQLSSGTADDVILHYYPNQYAKAGYLADLSNQLYAGAVLGSVRKQLSPMGKLIAMGMDLTSGLGIYYNGKLFADNGWDTQPKTWNDFVKLCDAIKLKGIDPFSAGFKDAYSIPWFLYADDVDIMLDNQNFEFDLYNGKTTINCPGYEKKFTKFQTLCENGYFNKDCLSIDTNQSRVNFEQGKAAMVIDGPWMPAQIDSESPGFQTRFMPLPDDNGNFYMGVYVGTYISVNAKTPLMQEALDLAGCMASKTALPIRYKDVSNVAIKDAQIEFTLPAMIDINDALKKYPNGLASDCYLPDSVWNAFTEIMSGIAAGQKFDPAQLKDIQSTYEKDKSLIVVPQ